MKAILTGDLIKHTHVAVTSTNSLSASLPGTQTHSQSNPRFKEAVLHIADSWPLPERESSDFLKGAFSFDHPPESRAACPREQHMSVFRGRRSEDTDDVWPTLYGALSSQLSAVPTRMYASLPGAAFMLAAPVLKSASWWPAESKQSETGCEKEWPFPATKQQTEDRTDRMWETGNGRIRNMGVLWIYNIQSKGVYTFTDVWRIFTLEIIISIGIHAIGNFVTGSSWSCRFVAWPNGERAGL